MSALLDIKDLWVEGRPPGGYYMPIVKGVSLSVKPGEVLAPSPLLAFESEYFTLHYQIAPDGDVTSPQAPVGAFQNLANFLAR